MAEPAQPRSRRERPAKPALTRDGIIETAVRLMRAEGLERVTMRRLATELDTGPASLYVYVANTAELHAAVLDDLIGEVDLTPAAAAGDWRERTEAVLVSYGQVLYEHGRLAHSALLARPSGANYLRLIEALLTLLIEGGVPDAQAAWGVDVLLQGVTASVAEHSQDDPAHSEEDWHAVTAAVNNASPATTPHVAALASQLLSGTPRLRQKWQIQMALSGIAHTPIPTA